jgi:hypothetical protein
MRRSIFGEGIVVGLLVSAPDLGARPYSRDNEQEVRAALAVQRRSFQGRADHPVQTGRLRQLRKARNRAPRRIVDTHLAQIVGN